MALVGPSSPEEGSKEDFQDRLDASGPSGEQLTTKLPRRLDVGEQAFTYYDAEAVRQNALKEGRRIVYAEAGATPLKKKRSRTLKVGLSADQPKA